MEQQILDYKPDDGSKPEDSTLMKITKLVTVLAVLYVIIFY